MSSITKYKLKSGKELYRVQYTADIDPVTGKLDRRSKRGFKNKREAKLWIAKTLTEMDQHGFVENENVTYKEVYEYFIKNYKQTVKESTLNRVKGLFKYHILPSLGNKPIKKITIPTCQEMVMKWADELVDFRKVINYSGLVFKEARRLKIIYDNPMELVVMPKTDPNRHKKSDDKFWDKNELATFLEYCHKKYDGTNEEAVALFRLLAFTGARKAEILALQLDDFDSSTNTLIINKTITRDIKNRQTIGTPKTINGYRTLYLDQNTANILNHWINTMHKNMLMFGFNTSSGDQLIFPNTKNKLLSLMKPNKWMDSIVKFYNDSKPKNKLKRITPHGLRHTWATLALEAGTLSVKQIQRQLGDSDVQTVLNTYSHVTNKASEETIVNYSQYLGF